MVVYFQPMVVNCLATSFIAEYELTKHFFPHKLQKPNQYVKITSRQRCDSMSPQSYGQLLWVPFCNSQCTRTPRPAMWSAREELLASSLALDGGFLGATVKSHKVRVCSAPPPSFINSRVVKRFCASRVQPAYCCPKLNSTTNTITHGLYFIFR